MLAQGGTEAIRLSTSGRETWQSRRYFHMSRERQEDPVLLSLVRHFSSRSKAPGTNSDDHICNDF